MARNREYNYHHLIAKSRAKEGFNVGVEKNLKRIRIRIHNALHGCVGTKLPKDQLKMWLNLHQEILSNETRDFLKYLINLEDDEFYTKDVIREGTPARRSKRVTRRTPKKRRKRKR